MHEASAKQIYSDVPTSYMYYDEIMYLYETGIVDGSSKYRVNDNATREEVAVMIAKAAGLNGTQRATKFADVPKSNKNSGYIQSAVEAGIINGFPDGTFGPNKSVTRGQMAAFIGRTFKLPASNKTFKDVTPKTTGYEFVGKLAAANITTGYTDGTFKPYGTLSRAHLSVFVYRAIQFNQQGNNKAMKVHFIDVDQGDSIFIQLASGKTVLVDAGTDAAGETVVAYLKSLGVSTIDYVIATHPDADHIGGMIDVLNAFKVNTFVNSGKTHTSKTYENMLVAIKAEGAKYVEPKNGQVFENDPALQSFFKVLFVNANASDNNDASIVTQASYCGKNVLLMGDASQDIEKEIIKSYPTLKAQVVKAGHHGSSTSSALEFFKAVSPNAVVLSYGEGNSYGHPHQEVLANIAAVKAKAYSTSTSGTIVATVNCQDVKFSASEFKFSVENNKDVNSGEYVVPGASTTFANCTEMRKVYPSGVKKGHPAYAAKHDRDNDGWSCE